MTSSMPPSGSRDDQPGPEYLEQGGGGPLPRETRRGGGGGRRKAVLAGAVVVGLSAVGGGVWAAASFFASGPQPAEALPASTLGYVSVDLDPSGGQKLEAIRTLNKFPAIEDELGLAAGDDLKRKLFDLAELAENCDGLDYDRHLEPWLGDRAAVAAVDLGKEQPVPVAIVQVTDVDAAVDGLTKLRQCADEEVSWTIEGDWAVVAETEELARQVAAETAAGTLADDATYQRWTDEVGDAGVLNLYADPAAGDYLATNLGGLRFPLGPMGMPHEARSSGETAEDLKDFEGAAATLRFDDGALELEAVGDAALVDQVYTATEAGDDVLASLPGDTAAAIGFGLQDGWGQRIIDEIARTLGPKQTDRLVGQAQLWTGLELPEDVETLLGDSTVVAVGPDFDPEAFENSQDGSGVPVGLKVQGDAAEIERVLDKIRAGLGAPMSEPLRSRTDGDVVAVGPDDDYLSRILEDGDLGDSEAFRNVVREAERAGAVVFVNFDAGGGWLSALAEGDPKVRENLEPLDGFGMSSWQDGDVGHGVARLTTD